MAQTPAGPELDAQVAKALGWKRVGKTATESPFPFSTDIGIAMRYVWPKLGHGRSLQERPVAKVVGDHAEKVSQFYVTWPSCPNDYFADTEAEVICRAFLKEDTQT